MKILMIRKLCCSDDQFKIQRLFSKAFHAVGEDVYIPPMMLRLSLMSNISIWLRFNPLVLDWGSRLLSSRTQSGTGCWSEIRFHADISPNETAIRGVYEKTCP